MISGFFFLFLSLVVAVAYDILIHKLSREATYRAQFLEDYKHKNRELLEAIAVQEIYSQEFQDLQGKCS